MFKFHLAVRWLTPLLTPSLALCAVLAGALAERAAAAPRQDSGAAETEAELELERADLDRRRRRGDRAALAEIAEWAAEEPQDTRMAVLAGLALRDAGRWRDARLAAERALEASREGALPVRSAAARLWLQLALDVCESAEALARMPDFGARLDPARDARDAWLSGRVRELAGDLDGARKLWLGASRDETADWERQLARARCERALGELVAASASLLRAEDACRDGVEPDVLAERAALFFEADGEIEHPEAAARKPGELYRKALALHRTHAPSLLGLFELGRFNWNRQSTPAHEWLGQLLTAVPDSIEGLLAQASADLDDGRLPNVRATLARLEQLAPRRRERRILVAALAWVEHEREAAESMLAELAVQCPADATPERELARHLCELYRFAEAAPFARRATERDPQDHHAFLELGRALANIGDEEGGLAALKRSDELARKRQNAWRSNTIQVLESMARRFVVEDGDGELRYAWTPNAADVLRAYWMPFYSSARAELAARYGHTPGPVVIEVFDRIQDFSVRSTGFEGFPALGVCFGPVVTSVAPQSELRGRFSWARTSFHEFTHVVHLGLSHNRCPRWITEGLATWEEEHKNPAWTRNMRRELLDAYWNRDLILVRDLNRAFRSQRILFGYYMSGQLCRMLIDEHGFPPMIALLEAFDRGEDLDAAIRGTFRQTPEELDRRFAEFVRRGVEPLRIEPRWSAARTTQLKFELGDSPPSDATARAKWAEGWCSVAWGYWQGGRKVDAEQALRKLSLAGALPPRALFLQAARADERDDAEEAKRLYEQGIAQGGEDFLVRVRLADMALEAEDEAEAERQLLAAERAYPGFDQRGLSAELRIARLYEEQERTDDRIAALERWIRWESDDFALRMEIGAYHAEKGNHARAVVLFNEANEIDPFRRELHRLWGTSLAALARHAEAAREFAVQRAVPPELDPDDGEPLDEEERAESMGREALARIELGELELARELVREALALDGDCESAESALERLEKGN
ncbi:MAG: hypothetical protein ACKO4Q_09375 [Planctomycetota bacterium]